MSASRWRSWVLAVAVLAGVRVFVFAAAFPFFNGIDEHLHFDLVQKYSRGFLPGPEMATFDAVTARLAADHGSSMEYIFAPEDSPLGRLPGPEETRKRRPRGSSVERHALQTLTRRTNIESDAPPTYYAAAGAWLRLGRALQLDGLGLLYWVRWLNPLLLGASVLVLAALLRRSHPHEPFLQLGPLALLAVWPNDLLYGVTPDVASVLLGALCLAGLARLAEGSARLPLFFVTGLAVGAAFLNKYSNLLLVLVALGVFVRDVATALRARRVLPSVARWLVFALAAGLPALWWLERNVRVLGSLSGQHRKIVWMQWTSLSPAQMVEHPLVGLEGWPAFLHGLAITFWRGEFLWHARPMSLDWVDAIYVASSSVFLALAAWVILRSGMRERTPRTEGIALAICFAAVLVLAAISLLFDYGVDEGPLSRAHPYFSSGRLVAAAAAPFALLYCRGIDRLWSRASGRTAGIGCWATLGIVLALALGSEIAFSASAFASPWNWYHAR